MSKLFASWLFSLMLSMGFVQGCVQQQPLPEIPAPPADPVAEKAVDEILARWEKRSADIQTIKAEFTRENVSKQFPDQTKLDVEYMAKGTDLALMILKETNKKGEQVPSEEFLLTTDQFYRYLWQTHKVAVSPRVSRQDHEKSAEDVAKNGGFMNRVIFSLFVGMQEIPRIDGPYLLLKIRAKDLKDEYRVDLMPERQGRYHLRLIPKTQGRRAEFQSIDVLLDKEKLQPIAIRVTQADSKDSMLFRFSKITVNPELPDGLFKAQILKGWKEERLGVLPSGVRLGIPSVAK